MITPELKGLLSDSLPPDDSKNCCVSMVASIGPKGEAGADYFYFTVVTPRFLSQNHPYWGKYTLVVESLDLSVIERSISTLLETKTASSWQDLANELNTFMSWEFYNYEPSKA